MQRSRSPMVFQDRGFYPDLEEDTNNMQHKLMRRRLEKITNQPTVFDTKTSQTHLSDRGKSAERMADNSYNLQQKAEKEKLRQLTMAIQNSELMSDEEKINYFRVLYKNQLAENQYPRSKDDLYVKTRMVPIDEEEKPAKERGYGCSNCNIF